MSRHLRRDVSALVDGQLEPARAEVAHEHLLGCGQCQSLVAAERRARLAMRGWQPGGADLSLTRRLATIPELPAGQQPVSRSPGRAVVVAGALASLSVFAFALFVLGGQHRPGHEPGDVLATTGPLQLSAPVAPSQIGDQHHSAAVLQWASASGWVSPETLPPQMLASSAMLYTGDDDTGAIMRLDLEHSGQRITVLEQRGELDPVVLSALEPQTVGDHQVYRVNGDWWVLQCDDMVVAVTSGPDSVGAHAVIAALPPSSREPASTESTVTERMMRGWRVLTDAG